MSVDYLGIDIAMCLQIVKISILNPADRISVSYETGLSRGITNHEHVDDIHSG